MSKVASKLVALETTRYSTMFRRILDEYRVGVQVSTNGRSYGEADIDDLLVDWCTNRNIRNTRNFRLTRDGVGLFGFHDSPEELWASCSELPFVQRLKDERILRYEVLPVRRVSGCFLRLWVNGRRMR